MEYVIIPPNRYDDVIEHLKHNFFADEPLNASIKLCESGEGHAELEKHSLKTLQDGLSVMAVTSDDEIAGVCLNGILQKGDIETSLANLHLKDDEKFRKIFTLLYTENLKNDLFEKYHIDKIFEIRILSVDSKFRGHGVAGSLMLKSKLVAEENGFRLMKSDATGLFSQKVATSLGFVAISEQPYTEYLDENNEPIFNVSPPHKSLKIMYKLLTDIDASSNNNDNNAI